MCGIVGFTGQCGAAPVLMEGLGRQEYRGYDSAGLATISDGKLHVRKRMGRIAALAARLQEAPAPGTCGIGHTRWATHGVVTDGNAHPHLGGDDLVAVVHNGVIENHVALKKQLEARGIVFRSQTDSEVIAHLIASLYQGDLVQAVRLALERLVGAYALAVISPRHPGLIVGARLGTPVALGVGRGENFLISDPVALGGYTDQVVYLEDHQLCTLLPHEWHVLDRQCVPVQPRVQTMDRTAAAAEKGDFEHYMLKEIYEQPKTVEAAFRGRIGIVGQTAWGSDPDFDPRLLGGAERIILTACGTSYHAALVGEYLFEELAGIPTDVEYASEFRYRNSPVTPSTLVIALTQSGETADTLAALRESKRKGHQTVALCNGVGSTAAREADGVIYLRAGPEVAVASTKTFLAQLTALILLSLHIGRQRQLSASRADEIIQELRAVPNMLRSVLQCRPAVRKVAEKYADSAAFFYLGRLYQYPIALEGALKLKEVGYVHADGYPAGEMKHGPIALIGPRTPSVFLVPRGRVSGKIMSNLDEVKARKGPVIAVVTEGDEEAAERADDVITIPDVPDYLQPLLTIVPLQFLAYEIARLRGCDIDRPRNLAKSVTVE